MPEAKLTYNAELINNIFNKNYGCLQNKLVQEPTTNECIKSEETAMSEEHDINIPIPAKISKDDFYNMLRDHNPNKKSTTKSQKEKKRRKIAKMSKRINRKR